MSGEKKTLVIKVNDKIIETDNFSPVCLFKTLKTIVEEGERTGVPVEESAKKSMIAITSTVFK